MTVCSPLARQTLTSTVVSGAKSAILRARSRLSAIFSLVDRDDRVLDLEARAGGRTVRRDLADERALGFREAERGRRVVVDVLDLDAEPAAADRAALLQLLDDVERRPRRNREGDADVAARRAEDRRVDADHLALEVERRAAGVALVHGRVDLDEVVGARADVAAERRDDAGRHRAAEAERIADGKRPVADAAGLSANFTNVERLVLADLILSSAMSVRGSVPTSSASSFS